ncbi:hypothetical protein [Aurantiacibacter sediminis]|uniref:DUF306 domain-containing protein n=1 Tax=Aurantiacibacter sediminis TaxID=2793064 RepID=A0ABS0N1C2_9SPHN|nr:hypothetical protein [Aurantiacibacter sediminis]MBH5321754.1 hypothetical protein [Aurantiacibacter sediminis]
MLKRIAILIAALLAFPAQALANDLEGAWALKIDDAIIFIFELDQAEDGAWSGSWTRPAEFGTNGAVFGRISGSTTLQAVGGAERDGAVRLVFRERGQSNVFQFEQTGEHQVRMTYVDTPLEPFPLIRVAPGSAIGPFEEGRIYDRDNAVTEEPYVDIVPDAEEASEQPEEMTERDGLSDDFLTDLDEARASEETDAAIESASSEEVAEERACEDLRGDTPPTAAELDALWGDDYEAIGSGLDIREYTLSNGDTARVTILGERIYVNRCGAED